MNEGPTSSHQSSTAPLASSTLQIAPGYAHGHARRCLSACMRRTLRKGPAASPSLLKKHKPLGNAEGREGGVSLPIMPKPPDIGDSQIVTKIAVATPPRPLPPPSPRSPLPPPPRPLPLLSSLRSPSLPLPRSLPLPPSPSPRSPLLPLSSRCQGHCRCRRHRDRRRCRRRSHCRRRHRDRRPAAAKAAAKAAAAAT
jgi:hypothetical protein